MALAHIRQTSRISNDHARDKDEAVSQFPSSPSPDLLRRACGRITVAGTLNKFLPSPRIPANGCRVEIGHERESSHNYRLRHRCYRLSGLGWERDGGMG